MFNEKTSTVIQLFFCFLVLAAIACWALCQEGSPPRMVYDVEVYQAGKLIGSYKDCPHAPTEDLKGPTFNEVPGTTVYTAKGNFWFPYSSKVVVVVSKRLLKESDSNAGFQKRCS